MEGTRHGGRPIIPYPRLIQTRVAVLFLVLLLAMAALTMRLAYLMLWQHDRLTDLAVGQRFRGQVIEPERGRVLDRRMEPLAMSVYADALYARPDRVGDRAAMARRLSELTGLDEAYLAQRLEIQAPAVLLATKLEPHQAQAIREARLPGISLHPRPQRFYPHGDLAGHVLGFAGTDNQGLEGLEFYYDHLLAGTPGRSLTERDPQGRAIPDGREEVVPPVAGHTLILTIDRSLQYLVERELRAAVEATKASWGVAISVDPRTGEILAMAQYPSFNPNNPQQSGPFRNRAISDQYEPGSTFKTVIAAIALELGVAQPDEVFDCPAELHIGGGRVRDWRYPYSYGIQTLEQALANSCNTVFARLGGELIPTPELVRYLRAFGFGDTLGIDFPGEAKGFLPTPGRVYGETLRWANVGFGQGVAVTPLQLTMAVAALVNDGYLMRPHLVKEIRDAAGRTVERREPEVIRQVVSARTARQMVRAMEKVVLEGTGSLAAIEGYRVLGKTGTAQIPQPGGYGEGRVASFIGAAPAEDPQVVTHVVLYDVKTEVRYGGQLAAPVFGRITERILEHRQVPRVRLAGNSRPPAASRQPSSPTVVPPSDPLPTPVAAHAPEPGEGQTSPTGPAPAASLRAAGHAASAGTEQEDWWSYGLADLESSLEGPVVVPDVRGLTIRVAVDRLEQEGLRIRVRGSGIARRQEPAPGRTVPPRTAVEVFFEAP